MKKLSPPIERLHELFTYDPKDGKLRWKKRDRGLTGKVAGGIDPGRGYRRVRVDGVLVLAHRIIIAMTSGYWPEHEVDHINGMRDDNRLSNLRCVSRSENLRNKRRYKSNKSGKTGVYWHRQHKKWCASVSVGGRSKTIGVFHTRAKAEAARNQAEIENGYHKNHGRA